MSHTTFDDAQGRFVFWSTVMTVYFIIAIIGGGLEVGGAFVLVALIGWVYGTDHLAELISTRFRVDKKASYATSLYWTIVMVAGLCLFFAGVGELLGYLGFRLAGYYVWEARFVLSGGIAFTFFIFLYFYLRKAR